MKKSNDTIGNRTRDLPACSLNQLRYRVPLFKHCTLPNSAISENKFRMKRHVHRTVDKLICSWDSPGTQYGTQISDNTES